METKMITHIASKRWVFLLQLFVPFALGYFLSDLYRSVNAVLASTLISEFHLNATELGFMTSAYFLGFAIVQLPLGVCLDRFGARRTLSVALLFGALGAVMFSVADNVVLLIIGRGLVGVGVGGCLMSALKAFAENVAYRKLPILNSLLTFVGGVGVMTATKPLYFSLQFMDWRDVFVTLAAATVLCSAIIFFVAPKKSTSSRVTESFGKQFQGFATVLKSRKFLAMLPIATFVQATYLSFDTLWVGTWYKDVSGFSAAKVANLLLIVSISLTAGYLLNGLVAGWLQRYNVKIRDVSVVAIIGFTAVLGVLGIASLLNGAGGETLWPLMIFLGPFILLFYPVFTTMFDSSLTGRVLTLYNLAVFLAAFALQYISGVIIDMWPSTGQDGYSPKGYATAILLIFLLHVLSLLWFALLGKDSKSGANYNEAASAVRSVESF